MDIMNEYISIINEYCDDHEYFNNHHLANSKSNLINSIIFSLKYDFSSYQKSIADFVPNSNEKYDYFLFLEGRIRFISSTKSKEILKKGGSGIKIEFLDFCKKALSIYPYAFLASTHLALYYESCRKFKDAIEILINIYNHGFTSKTILWSIIYESIMSHNWKTYKHYVEKVEPSNIRFLIKAFYILERYSLIRPFIGFSCIAIPFLSYWYIYICILIIISAILVYFVYHSKNKIIFSLLVYYSFITMLGLLVGFLCKLYG